MTLFGVICLAKYVQLASFSGLGQQSAIASSAAMSYYCFGPSEQSLDGQTYSQEQLISERNSGGA